ncbi:MAG: hypothetical protein JNM00_15020 [Flavobacteriales bacterium]|nr:hypothetical protein [Flavobacteriales bacterium]
MTNETTQPTSGTTHILVLGRHQYLLENVQKILHSAGYESSGFLEREEAEEFLRMNHVDVLLVGGGVEPHERQGLIAFVRTEFPAIKVVEHFGGPATILPEIKSILAR